MAKEKPKAPLQELQYNVPDVIPQVKHPIRVVVHNIHWCKAESR